MDYASSKLSLSSSKNKGSFILEDGTFNPIGLAPALYLNDQEGSMPVTSNFLTHSLNLSFPGMKTGGAKIKGTDLLIQFKVCMTTATRTLVLHASTTLQTATFH